jgi:hypothetical protein
MKCIFAGYVVSWNNLMKMKQCCTTLTAAWSDHAFNV